MSNNEIKRPQITKETVRMATNGDWGDEKSDDIADVFQEHMDGYELMRELEQWHSWDGCTETVNELEDVFYDVEKQYKEEIKAWVEKNNIQASVKVGQKVTYYGEAYIVDEVELPKYRCLLKREDQDASDTSRRVGWLDIVKII